MVIKVLSNIICFVKLNKHFVKIKGHRRKRILALNALHSFPFLLNKTQYLYII